MQIQQSWSERFNVNLLAAGVSKPSIGNTGSGIYNGRYGPLISHMMTTSITHLFTVEINKSTALLRPNTIKNKIYRSVKKVKRSEMLPLLLQRENLVNYSYYFLDFNNNKTINTTVCSNEGFCCDFYTKISISISAQSVRIY